MIGAEPNTKWLDGALALDKKGFVIGDYYTRNGTSQDGVFVVGDARSGSIKRVASAVGEGATAIQLVHEYLKEL